MSAKHFSPDNSGMPEMTSAVTQRERQRAYHMATPLDMLRSPGSADSATYPDLSGKNPYRSLPPAEQQPPIEGMRPPEHDGRHRLPEDQQALGRLVGRAELPGVGMEAALNGMLDIAEQNLATHGKWEPRPDREDTKVGDLYNSVTLYDAQTATFTNIEGQQRAYLDGVDGRILVTDQTPRLMGNSLSVADSKRRRAPGYIPGIVFDSKTGTVDERYSALPADVSAVENWNTAITRSVPVSPEAVAEYTNVMLAGGGEQLAQFNEHVIAQSGQGSES
jgi:hypothetical protein